jgi:hypothetical protein
MNHNRKSKIAVIFTLIVLVLLVGVVPASAQAKRIYYTSYECPISMTPPERQWVSEDGILHQRGVHQVNEITSSTPYLTGYNYLEINADISLVTGEVHVYGKVDLQPTAYEGSWIGFFTTHISSEGVLDGKATARGTGDLEGMMDFNNMHFPLVPDPACFNMDTAEDGYILVPHE